MSNKPITEEQVDRLIESLPPMYDKDFRQSFKNCIKQARNQAFKEVEAIGKRYKNAKYSTDQFVISGKKWDKLKKLMEVEK